jgi:hypothetical protein
VAPSPPPKQRKFGCVHILVLVAAGLATAVVYVVYFSGPAINVTKRSRAKDVDFMFLGEYCIGISRVRIRDLDSGRVVWEVAARKGLDAGICKLSLQVGENPASVGIADPTTFSVVVPHVPTFQLSAARRYRLCAWGNNGFAEYNRSCTTLRF